MREERGYQKAENMVDAEEDRIIRYVAITEDKIQKVDASIKELLERAASEDRPPTIAEKNAVKKFLTQKTSYERGIYTHQLMLENTHTVREKLMASRANNEQHSVALANVIDRITTIRKNPSKVIMDNARRNEITAMKIDQHMERIRELDGAAETLNDALSRDAGADEEDVEVVVPASDAGPELRLPPHATPSPPRHMVLPQPFADIDVLFAAARLPSAPSRTIRSPPPVTSPPKRKTNNNKQYVSVVHTDDAL